MAAPAGTYIVPGPIVGTAEKPDASRELFEAGAVWVGEGEVEVIAVDNGVYSWVPVGTKRAEEIKLELEGLVGTERQDRATADVALGSRIDAEIVNRQNGDTTLDQKITAETSAREQDDTALGRRIDTEVTDRTAGDQSLSNRIPAKVRNEDVDAEIDDVRYVTVLKTFRAIARKVKNASTTVRGIALLARNEDVDATETDTSRIAPIDKIKRLLDRLRPSVRQPHDTKPVSYTHLTLPTTPYV